MNEIRAIDPDSGVLATIGHTPLIFLRKLFSTNRVHVYGKLEGINPGGSIKDRTARQIIVEALEQGHIRPGDTVIESSSGNMAIGLAQACLYFGLNLIVVVDPKVNQHTVRILKAYGAEINQVTEPDPVDGYLGARLARVQELLETVPHSYWSNQYANPNNPLAHRMTMAEIISELEGNLDYLFVATSTCGTLMGCAQYVHEHHLPTKIVAVDAVGSVIFGTPAAPRLIPGHGAGRPSQLINLDYVDEVVHISDWECIQGCRRLLAQEAILAGGSSGAVVAAVQKKLPQFPDGSTVAMILCDRGERYLETIYADEWVKEHFEKELRGKQAAVLDGTLS